MKVSRVRLGVEIGLTIALSAVLGLIAPWQMPQGGSPSFTMLPLFILALLRGWGPGCVAGALYGVVDFMIEPYFFTPVQVLLDYPVAYALCGLAGLFSPVWWRVTAAGDRRRAFFAAAVPGIVLGTLGRYVAHVLSGLVFFSSYAIEAGQAPLIYSLAYNSFVLVSGVAAAIVAAAVLPALARQFGGGGVPA